MIVWLCLVLVCDLDCFRCIGDSVKPVWIDIFENGRSTSVLFFRSKEETFLTDYF